MLFRSQILKYLCDHICASALKCLCTVVLAVGSREYRNKYGRFCHLILAYIDLFCLVETGLHITLINYCDCREYFCQCSGPYLILAVTFGFTLLTTEIAIGRKTKQSPLTAYGKIHKKFGFLGVLACLVPVIIMPYYSVIGGWVVKYFLAFLTGDGLQAAEDGYFTGFITGQWEPLILMILFLGAVAFIIYRGVEKGIESFSKVLMPVLFLLVIGIAVFTLTISYTDESGVTRNGLQGLKIYVIPDVENLTVKSFFSTLLDAMGQLFFSLSVAMGIMIAYGSYVKDEDNLVKSINQIEILDRKSVV